jgi:adenosylcobinamide-phosphate synthase
MLRDSKKTQSPNAGLTMSAMAGALGVQLEKSGYYILGDAHNPLSARTLDASINVISVTAVIWTLLIILSQVVYYVAA